MRYELKSIGIWAFIKMAFFLNMIVGFAYGVFLALYLIMAFKFAGAAIMEMSGINPDDINPGIFLVVIPLVTSFFSTVLLTLFELLIVGLYNLFTKFLGGLEFQFEPIQPDIQAHIPVAQPVAQVAPVASMSPMSPMSPVTPAAPIAPPPPASIAPVAPDATIVPPPPPPSTAPPMAPDTQRNRPDSSPDDTTGSDTSGDNAPH